MSVYLKAENIGGISVVSRVENGQGVLMLAGNEGVMNLHVATFDDMQQLASHLTKMMECQEWDRSAKK